MKRMRVLIHTNDFAQTLPCTFRMLTFADALESQGHEVVIIASSMYKGDKCRGDRKEKIIYSPAVRMKKKTTLMRMLNQLSFGITSIFSALKVGKTDVVITTSPPPLASIPGWIIAKLKHAKLIYDVRDIWPDVALEMNSFSENSIYCRVFGKIADFMYKHADIITTVSEGKVNKIRQHLLDCGCSEADAEKVKLVGNGFDETILKSEFDQSVVEKYGLDNKFSCVFIGNIGLAQGLEVLLDVASKTKHKDIQFLLFGDGAEKELLQRKAEDAGLTNVHFCGKIDHEKVFTVYSKAKMSFISLKSAAMKDSIPTKTYESLGIGCPVLLVAEGDSCDIVNKSGLGVCVSPDDSDKIPQIFDEMAENYEQYISKRENCMNLIVNEYSRQKIAANFVKLIEKLAGFESEQVKEGSYV